MPKVFLVTVVLDRPGHELRDAIGASEIKNELNWAPKAVLKLV